MEQTKEHKERNKGGRPKKEATEKLELGDNISIHPMCYFECSGGLMIGNNVSIAHSSSILTSTHTYSDFNLPIIHLVSM